MAKSRTNSNNPNAIDGVPVGGVTPAAGAFTTLSASGVVALNGSVSGIALTNYLAAPAAIGGTTPNAGTFTTMSAATGVLSNLTLNNPVSYSSQPAPPSFTASSTLTVAQMLTGIVVVTGTVAVTLTFPTGASLDSGLPAGLANDMAFEFSIIYTSTSSGLVAGNTGVTIVGNTSLPNGTGCARFRVRKTATSTYIAYRIAG